MVSVIAPLIAVRFSPQAFVFSISLGRIPVDHIKFADTFIVETSSMYTGDIQAFAAESLELYHFNFWSYIVLHFSLLLFGVYLIIIFFPFTTYIPFDNPSRLQLRRTLCPFMLNTPSMPRL